MDWALFGYREKDYPDGVLIATRNTKEELKDAETWAIAQGFKIQYVHADGSMPDFKATVNKVR